MILPIVKYGSSVLHEKSTPIVEITDGVRQLVADMLETMYDARGLGLAAEQVGRTEALCVIDVPAEVEKEECVEFNSAIKMPLIMLNPEIINESGTQRDPEGCLSFPNISAQITRANEVTVTYLDLSNQRHTITACGLLARAIQHEVDHLNGVLLVDSMSPMQRLSLAGQLKRLHKKNKSA